MLDRILSSNFAITTIASGISNSATTINLATGKGALFPAPVANQYAKLVLFDTAGNKEVIHCSARSTDQITVARGQEGTAARAWNTGDGIACVTTSGQLDEFVQRREIDYLTAGGTANAITLTPDPALAAYSEGGKVKFKVANANTAAVTLNVSGIGAKSLKTNLGIDLKTGELFVGQIIEAYYNGTEYHITSSLAGRTEQVVTVSGTNTYTAGLTPAATSLPANTEFLVRFTNANTAAAPTLNIDSTGAKTIKTSTGGTVAVGDILAGEDYRIRYDGTDFRIVGKVFSQAQLAAEKTEPATGTDYVFIYDAATGAFKKVKITNFVPPQAGKYSALTSTVNATTPASQLDVSATTLVLKNSSGDWIMVDVSAIANIAVSGVSGLDTGAEGANTFYYVHAIRKTTPITGAAVTCANATDVITHTAHGMAANSPIKFAASAMPAGLTAGVTYYIRDITTDTYKVAATPNGTAINFTTDGTSVTVTEVPALLLSASATAPTLPSGYTFSARTGFVRNDGSSNFIKYMQVADRYFYAAGQSVLSGGSASTSTSVSVASYVPSAICKDYSIDAWMYDFGAGSGNNYARLEIISGSLFSEFWTFVNTDQKSHQQYVLPSAGNFYYYVSATDSPMSANVTGVTLV